MLLVRICSCRELCVVVAACGLGLPVQEVAAHMVWLCCCSAVAMATTVCVCACVCTST